VSKLQFGQRDSDSVKRLQDVLNGISLSGGRELRVSGDYDELTRDEVKKWQKQVAKGPASILRWQPRPTAGPSDIRTDG
jgi:hypothetical protein